MAIKLISGGAMAVAGVATHLGYFNRGEHHLYGLRYLQIFLVLFATAVTVVVRVGGEPVGQAFTKTASLAGSYLGGLYTSLIIYRIFLGPLNKFPGPFGARISNIWFSAQLRNRDAYKRVLRLHEKYGDFLRIGSSDLSIIHPKAVNAIYGHGSKCTKAAWYDLTYPMVSLQTTRQRALHDRRRRIWSPAFSDKALRGYEDRIKIYRDQLIAQIAAFGGQPVNATKWFNLFSFDVMGDLAFGTSFNMLETSEEHWAIKLLNEAADSIGWMFPMWCFRLFIAIPGLTEDWWKFIRYCSQKLDERINTKVNSPDIMSALLDPWKNNNPTGTDLAMLQGDAQLIVVAGSDTTAATLTYIFYELARNPCQLSKLRDEVATHVTSFGDVSHQKIQYLDHLNGVINETLRLHPPVPTALQRNTPPEGIKIGETYVPGNMTVWCPQYVIGRSEKIYTNAQTFVPERWYSQPEMVKERTAFAPFSAGTYGCIGRPLALLNLRTTVAKLIMNFDVSFAPGEDGKNLEEKTRDHFTFGLGELNLTFTKR
ncbi:MAG: hypothetical protein M1830_009845 [Pleopsidium flavum]|nr:MAG: hypothetical protein M1830_009845 [Pleopsidium flavum]